MKKIVFLITALNIGGAEKALIGIIKRLSKNTSIEILVISVYGGDQVWKEMSASGIRRINLYKEFPPKILRIFYFFVSIVKLLKIIKNEKIILLISFLYEPAILSRFVQVLLNKKIKVINTIRATRQSMNSISEFIHVTIEKLTYKMVYKYVFVSRASMSYLVSKINIDQDRISIIENGVDLEKFIQRVNRNDFLAELLNVSSENYFIGTVGRICREKGFEYFIDAARDVLITRNDFYFIIFGEGAGKDKLLRKIKTLNLEKKVFILDFVKDIEKIYHSFDIYVCSSLSEGMSNTVMEAMASSVPIIATDIPANRELLVDGESAVLVKKKDPIAISRAILKIIENKKLQEFYTNSARKYIEEKYNITDIITKWNNLIEKEID